MNSKFKDMIFEGWMVSGRFVRNTYAKVYKNPKQKVHRAYSYLLVNTKNTKQYLILSGNTVRLLFNGTKTMTQLLSSTGGKNSELTALRKALK